MSAREDRNAANDLVEARFWRQLGHGPLEGLPIGAAVGVVFMVVTLLISGRAMDLGDIMAGMIAGAFGGLFFGAFLRLSLGGGMQG